MKKMITSLSTIIALALPVFAFASTWTIDSDHSNVGFKVRHLMVSNVKGSFEKFAGTVEIDDKDITKSKVEVSIDTNSINTKFPTMTFVSKKVVKSGTNNLKVTGDLTLHGVTRQVVLDVEGPTVESKDPWGGIRRGAVATTTINRKDFGLVWNKALETGGVAVGEEVTITLEIEMIKK